jgi:hypothetical protein
METTIIEAKKGESRPLSHIFQFEAAPNSTALLFSPTTPLPLLMTGPFNKESSLYQTFLVS